MRKEKLPDTKKAKLDNGPLVTAEDIRPANVKVRITTSISEDIYRWLNAEAQRTGTPYQILLNQILRQAFEASPTGTLAERVKRLEEKIRKLKAA